VAFSLYEASFDPLNLTRDFYFPVDNYPEAGKRPISSTVPSILEHSDGSFYMAIGGSGGSLIFGAVFQVLLNMDWGMDLSQAIEHGRLHNQLYPETTLADDTYNKHLLDALLVRGHNLTSESLVLGCFLSQ